MFVISQSLLLVDFKLLLDCLKGFFINKGWGCFFWKQVLFLCRALFEFSFFPLILISPYLPDIHSVRENPMDCAYLPMRIGFVRLLGRRNTHLVESTGNTCETFARSGKIKDEKRYLNLCPFNPFTVYIDNEVVKLVTCFLFTVSINKHISIGCLWMTVHCSILKTIPFPSFSSHVGIFPLQFCYHCAGR